MNNGINTPTLENKQLLNEWTVSKHNNFNDINIDSNTNKAEKPINILTLN